MKWKFRFTVALKLQRNFQNSKKYHFSHLNTHKSWGTNDSIIPILWNILGVQDYILKKFWNFLLRATNIFAPILKKAFFKQNRLLYLSVQKMCHMSANKKKRRLAGIYVYISVPFNFDPPGTYTGRDNLTRSIYWVQKVTSKKISYGNQD